VKKEADSIAQKQQKSAKVWCELGENYYHTKVFTLF
jgi:hypothetical protein